MYVTDINAMCRAVEVTKKQAYKRNMQIIINYIFFKNKLAEDPNIETCIRHMTEQQ